ncbi:GldG family protein [Polyangium sorediatum]|uniref:GldG family protein n=1 Tax=Polyangium sorediatum TaxID=889274 RepID=A0ABT6NZJ0_9BACT|nr:GldG family protein [Polyangium sorediatum]MDI1433766.1 GldG family protein [Polyangium sorediatum]
MSEERKPKKGKKAPRSEAPKPKDVKPRAPKAPEPPREATPEAPAGTSAGTKLGALVGLVAAMVLAVLVNVVAARHYRRFDFTKGGLYTLSPATVQTLHALGEPIRIDVLLPSGDPLALSIRHLLEAYRSETSRLEVHFTDPDRHAAEFVAVQRKYDERVVDGRVVTDAAIVITRGDRVQFITPRDLVEVEDENDVRARPRLEQALTAAIRAVVSTDRAKICFTTGHDEKSIETGGSGLAPLRERLEKNGHEVATVDAREKADDKDKARAPYAGCRVVVVAGPGQRFSEADTKKLEGFVEQGGNVLVAVGPVPDEGDQKYLDLGLDPLLDRFGITLARDFVFETDPRLRAVRGYGETFLPIAKPHPITEGLIRAEQQGLGAVMTVASSLQKTGKGAAAVSPLLETSEDAFGMIDFFTWAKNPSDPAPNDADHKGPLTVSFAAEMPKRPGAERGARFVALGSASPMMGENWQSDELRGTAIFVESAIAWLASAPTPLDIPNKPAFTAGLRMSEDSLASVFRYVVVFIPLASVLTGLAVHLRRRATERRGTRKEKERASE